MQMILLLVVLPDSSSQNERSTTKQPDSGHIDMQNEKMILACISPFDVVFYAMHMCLYMYVVCWF